MRENLIPRLWDNDKVAGIAADTQGMLRLRPPFDEAHAREIEFAKVRCPTLAPPFHVSPGIDAVDVTALLHELEWHRRSPAKTTSPSGRTRCGPVGDAAQHAGRQRDAARSVRNHRQNNRPVIR